MVLLMSNTIYCWLSNYLTQSTLTKNVIFNVLIKNTKKMPPHIWPNLTKSCNNYSLILNELHIKVLIYNYSPIVWYNFHKYSWKWILHFLFVYLCYYEVTQESPKKQKKGRNTRFNHKTWSQMSVNVFILKFYHIIE